MLRSAFSSLLLVTHSLPARPISAWTSLNCRSGETPDDRDGDDMGWDEYGIARYIALVIMKLASVEKIARRSPAGSLAG